MKGKLTAKQEKLIAAMLIENSYAAAAEKAGIAETTMYNWLKRPEFQSAFRAARRAVLDAAIGKLQQYSTDAADKLHEMLEAAEKDGDKIRAAIAILEYTIKTTATVEVLDRIEELERTILELKQNEKPAGPSEPGDDGSTEPDRPAT